MGAVELALANEILRVLRSRSEGFQVDVLTEDDVLIIAHVTPCEAGYSVRAECFNEYGHEVQLNIDTDEIERHL